MSSHKAYQKIASEIGDLVQEKNDAYGDSFGQSCRILEVLYPEGINPDQYRDALAITRVIDKLFRLANKKDAFGESPWRDIAGYAILGASNDERLSQDASIEPPVDSSIDRRPDIDVCQEPQPVYSATQIVDLYSCSV